MKLDTTTDTPGLTCVHCSYDMTHTTGDGVPESGDFTLCIDCGNLNVFDSNLRLRKATRAEAREATEMDEMQALRLAWAKMKSLS